MEEQRIGHMYWNLFTRKLQRIWDNLFPKGLRRSSALPIIVITLVILLPLAAWVLHRRGKFGSLKREIKGENVAAGPPDGPRPGGLDPIVLSRSQTPGSDLPEFRTVTLLPGLGMSVLQITATLPVGGDVPLLVGPTVQEIADGNTPQKTGPNDKWGAIEAPWGGRLSGLLTPLGTTFRTSWKGHTLEAPTDVQGRGLADGGMLSTRAADATETTPSHLSATGTYRGTDFDQHWASKNDVSVTATMAAQTLDLTVTVKNVGEEAEPMGIGWHPRFSIPGADRASVELRLPIGEQVEIGDRAKGTPTGKIVPVGSGSSRFQLHPAPLGTESLDVTLANLRPGAVDNGAAAELRNPKSGFGLRMTALSSSIKVLRATAPDGAGYASIGMQTNLDDPLGKEWSGPEDAPIMTLQPGQSAEWKVRLEIFAVSNR